jgi:hypothetical protein
MQFWQAGAMFTVMFAHHKTEFSTYPVPIKNGAKSASWTQTKLGITNAWHMPNK